MSFRRIRTLTSFIAVAAATLAAASAASAACPDEDLRPTAENLDRVRAAVVCLHNEERRAAGIAPLEANAILAASATAHASDMVARRYLAFETPDGVDPFDRIERAGYAQNGVRWSAGENIAWASGALSTPRSIMDGWMKSYGRRLTLIAGDFDEIGVGIALGAPVADYAGRSDAVTYTVDFGLREQPSPRALASCLRRASRGATPRARQTARTRCRGGQRVS